ncbi:Arylsulfatase [Novipirellula galeiformis]|uniref:Arylsulfatase n=1 Tax=Novipirellula galeiformis TaxID=2528004 RepID=A0A5C6CC91_9BACT|nr:arylsulfatase [Novipirellula galeiformis]TWU21071.1 Arylsulfatase [Novipirellula galeiformis]
MNAFVGFVRCLGFTPLVLLMAIAPTAAATPDRPNIVFIMADDLGYGELGCYGQEKIRTPNLDRLASEGMRFTQHYTGAPVCAPARCVLMTGQHLAHAQVRGNRVSGNGRIFPGQWPLNEGTVTIASVLKKSGYVTGAFGKWGLGPSNTSGSPIKQGFDRFYGYNCQSNAHSYYPAFLDNNEREVRINKYPIPGHDRKPTGDINAEDYEAENYAPDLILEEAVKFIDKHKDEPFFLYLPFVEPHVAMQPPKAWVDQYPAAWDEENGPYRGDNGYLPHPRPRAAYAAMISDLDEHVGTILKRLEDHQLSEKTLIVFTSDNGPTHGRTNPKFHVGGAACTFFNSTGGLRGFKGSCFEGGIRIPCIVKWPGRVQANSVSDMPSYFPDWFTTLSAVANIDLQNESSLSGISLDGLNLVPELTSQGTPERPSPMIWEFPQYGGIVAIREGKWKAIRRNLLQKKVGDWELYDLDADRAEQHDLAAANPEIVKRLETAYLNTRTIEPDFPLPLYDKVVR